MEVFHINFVKNSTVRVCALGDELAVEDYPAMLVLRGRRRRILLETMYLTEIHV